MAKPHASSVSEKNKARTEDNNFGKNEVKSEEPMSYHRRGYWFKSSTAYYTVR
jgi:hypothetical protein